MKVLFQGRHDVFTFPAGDTIQMKKTAEYLRRLGVAVDISADSDIDLEEYDLIHLFNISRMHETYFHFKRAKRGGKKVVLTPIYHDLREYNLRGRYGLDRYYFKLVPNAHLQETFYALARSLKIPLERKYLFSSLKIACKDLAKEILSKVDLWLCMTRLEVEALQERFGVKNRYEIVPNGVEKGMAGSDPQVVYREYGLKDFVLCVGKIEPLKNQLNLMKSLFGTGLPVVMIGQESPRHRGYVREFLKEVEKDEFFNHFPRINQELLGSFYAAARVHALPSWVENSPLVDLEAAVCGCNIVTTNRSFAKEYLGDRVCYIDPSNTNLIRRAVLAEYQKRRNISLQKYILDNFTWDKIATQILKYYLKVL